MPESCFMNLFRFHIFVSPALNHSLSLSNEISLVSLSSCEIVQVNAFPTSFKLRSKQKVFVYFHLFWCFCVRITISKLYHVTYPLFNACIRITISAECIFVDIHLFLQGMILRGLIEG